MLEEIQVMVEQLELMEQKMREMHGRHVDEGEWLLHTSCR